MKEPNGAGTMEKPSSQESLGMLREIAGRLPLKKVQSGERSAWFYVMLAAVVIGGYVGWKHFMAAGKAVVKAAAGVPVAVAAAKRGDIPVYLEGLGSVTAYYTVTIHSRVDGQLMNVNFKEGQYVHAGDVLAQIDSRPYQAMLDQAKGNLAKDQAILANAKLDFERYKDLIAQNAIPRQQFDTQVATVAQDEGAVKTDEAAVESAQLNVNYSRITAPINGRVGLRLVDPGNMVHAADPNGMLVITQMEPIAVLFTLPEDVLPQVMKKVRAGEKLQVLAYNRDKSQLLATGALASVDNQIDPTTGTSKLKAIFDNKDGALFPNQFVNVRLLVETRKGQVIIPSAAVQQGSKGSFVYVVHDGTAQMEPVTVGVTEGTQSSIDQGVNEGDSVVIDGAENVQPGGKVTFNNSTSDPATSAPAASGKDSTSRKHK